MLTTPTRADFTARRAPPLLSLRSLGRSQGLFVFDRASEELYKGIPAANRCSKARHRLFFPRAIATMKVLTPPQIFGPVNQCIYCWTETTGNLSREHIVPFGLGGNLILHKASCRSCQKITAKIEQSCLRGMLGNFRYRNEFPSYAKKKDRPKEINMRISKDGKSFTRRVPVSEYPRALMMFKLLPPGIIANRARSSEFRPIPELRIHSSDTRKFFGSSWSLGTYKNSDFCRMIAKIGHAYAVATQGLERLAGYELLLPSFIIGKEDDLSNHLVGDDSEPAEGDSAKGALLHHLAIHYVDVDEFSWAVARVRLFAYAATPGYVAIVGRKPIAR
jgi:hypothetical protein